MPLSEMPTGPLLHPSGLQPSSPSTSPAPSQAAGAPMAICQTRNNPPRPLPPPPHIRELSEGRDLGWRWGNDANVSDFGRPASLRAGSSLLDGTTRDDGPLAGDFGDFRRGSSASTIMPTDTASTLLQSPSQGLQSERALEQWTYEVRRASSKSYDNHLLGRFGGPSSPKRPSVSSLPEIVFPNSPGDSSRRHSSLRPFGALHERRHASLDSNTSLRMPDSGTNSPRSTGPWMERVSPGAFYYRAYDDAGSHRASYDQSLFPRDDTDLEDGHLGNLVLYDRAPSPRSGSKRRASSPPHDEREDRSSVSSASVSSDVNFRRAAQPPPPYRSGSTLRSHPNHSSLSSVSSCGPRNGSLASSLGLASQPSSATSCGSGRFSPGAVSPTAELDLALGVSGGGAKATALSPTTSHHRTMSESTQGSGARHLSTSETPHPRHSSYSGVGGGLVCECCPKKPKKFGTIEALRLHESEKQYSCQYCPNRFKNKNEAERHQMSLHRRLHSWSCGALPGPDAAFQSSPTNPAADMCGYCGLEFTNLPAPHRDARAEHLRAAHKFRDCNLDHKFFRADHFRQHLKHSHAGASGKWTSRLETACMQVEPAPPPPAPDAAARPAALRSLSALAIATSHMSPLPSAGS